MAKMFERKIVLLGDPGVGKTSLVRRYIYDTFQTSYMTTLGLNIYVRAFEYPNIIVKLIIWDIAGQESRRRIALRYLKGASGALLAYDLTDTESFEHLPEWYSDLKEANGKDIPVIVVGTKLDLARSKDIPLVYNVKKLGDTPVAKADLIFTSAKTDTNVDAAFNLMVQQLIKGLVSFPDLAPRMKEGEGTKILFFVRKGDQWSRIALNHIEKIGKKFAIEVETIDTEADPKFAEAHGVTALPTIIVGGRKLVGIIQISHLEEILTQLLQDQN